MTDIILTIIPRPFGGFDLYYEGELVSEDQIKLLEILNVIDYKPLFGNRRSKTHWLVFMKDQHCARQEG